MLDRVMANHARLQIYPSAVINHMPIIGSDHAPIILNTKSNHFNKLNKFRFEAKWILQENFMDIVTNAWKTKFNGSSAYQLVKRLIILRKK